ncbi:MAG: GNAT family N-acetyltransferase [Gallionellaceae bacterium]
MKIRILHTADDALYKSLWCNALNEHNEYFRTSSEDEPAPQIPTNFSDESFTLGAFINDSLVGSVSIERDSLKKLQHKALLFRMYVQTSSSGLGVGRALVTEAITLARTCVGVRQLNLTVLATNKRAIHLYSTIGFVVFAHEAESVKIGNIYVDEHQMAYFL